MPNLRDRRRLLWVILLAAGSVAAAGSSTCLRGQASPPAPPSVSADDALLAKAATLYYSAAKSGLSGFDCSIHPDWRGLFASVDSGAGMGSELEKKIALLNGVAIALHARLNGNSSLDWTPAPGSARDADSTELLSEEHSGTEQTLMGFMQFWTPFVNGAVVPSSAGGVAVSHTPATFKLHSEQPGAIVDEVFSNDLLLTEYDVIAGGSSVKLQPTYKATPQGLLVERFLIHIQSASDQSRPVEEIHTGIEYQTLQGFPIPQRLNMGVVEAAVFNFTLDGCKVNPPAN